MAQMLLLLQFSHMLRRCCDGVEAVLRRASMAQMLFLLNFSHMLRQAETWDLIIL
jgi:hypothetical protein